MNIYDAMQVRYAPPEWILAFEVRNKTGFTRGQVRYADAVAINTYPSRGHELHGFEFKMSRSDWLYELNDGVKAEAICAYCDRWWIVAPKEVAKPEEIPKSWGHIILGEGGLRTAKHAPQFDNVKARDWPFVVSLLRRVSERAPIQGLDSATELRIREECRKQEKENLERNTKQQKDAHDALVSTVARFEKASGVRVMDEWTWGRMDAALSLLGRRDDLAESLRRMKHDYERHARTLGETLDRMEAEKNSHGGG